MANQAEVEQLQYLWLIGYFLSYGRMICPINIGFSRERQIRKIEETRIIIFYIIYKNEKAPSTQTVECLARPNVNKLVTPS